MDEYSWPPDGDGLAQRASEHWAATVEVLPEGSAVSGRVIGRQPFGVFLAIADVPGAVGLAEITTMARGVALPPVGTLVHGSVIGHAGHNHQVRVRLWDY